MKFVLIEWVDSNFHHGWDSEIPELAYCVTAGILVNKCKESISVAIAQSNNGNMANCMIIPRKCITSIKELKL